MAVANSELSLTWGASTYPTSGTGITLGGSTARQITGWTIDEHDYTQGRFEFEFITTAATEAAFASELDTIRDIFRQPRLDLVVTQGSQNTLIRRHSNNLALNTEPYIVKDGDDADTGRSRHFRVRIEYELPADNVSTDFRRGATLKVEYTPSRRRTVTIMTTYTANSTDGTTTADAQYLARVTAGDLDTLLDQVDSSATWETVGEPQFEWFETRKVAQVTRIYREVNRNQSEANLDDSDIINPELIIERNLIAPGDSMEPGLTFGGSLGGPAPGGGAGSTVFIPGTRPISAPNKIRRPVLVTIRYDTAINFANTNLNAKWIDIIRPWLLTRARSAEGANQGVVLIDEKVDFDYYENRISATLQCIAYTATIIRQIISYQQVTVDGYVLEPTTSSDVFAYYEFPGPAVRQMIVVEERDELVTAGTTASSYLRSKAFADSSPGSRSSAFGDQWRRIGHEPEANVRTLGRDIAKQQTIAYAKIRSVFQFRNVRSPSIANAGGITGQVLTQ